MLEQRIFIASGTSGLGTIIALYLQKKGYEAAAYTQHEVETVEDLSLQNGSEVRVLRRAIEEIKPTIIIDALRYENRLHLFNGRPEKKAKRLTGQAGLYFGNSLTLLEESQFAPVQHYILLSSAAVYGSAFTLRQPLHEYGSEKKADDMKGMLRNISEQAVLLSCAERKCNATVLRLANLYGPRVDFGVVNECIFQMLRHEKITIYNRGAGVRDFVHVDDLLNIISAVIEKGVTGVYNVGTGIETTINKLVQEIQNTIGSSSTNSKIDFVEETDEKNDYVCLEPDAILRRTGVSLTPLQQGLEKTVRAIRNF